MLMPLLLVCGKPLCANGQLGIGALQITVDAGYDQFALPVANAALAREWASASGLAWQVAYNSSLVPVRMDIEHRQARALRGRIEVSTEYGYAAEESATAQPVVVTREFLVPPSVPTSLTLLPRVCPPSVSGGTVTLDFRVYLRDLPQPQFEQRLEVVQLEPAHLYSLYLTEPGSVDRDVINAGNHLGLTSPAGMSGKDTLFPPEMLQSRHYTIACDRRQVTLAPLAARDFAFVIADAGAVRSWPEEEQDGLAAYLIGGGYLCLFNAEGTWHGLDLSRGAMPVGRGNLLPVAGGYTAARREVTGWLEGELAEFVLWCEGRQDGWRPDNLIEMASLPHQVKNMRKGTPPWCRETGEPSGSTAKRAAMLRWSRGTTPSSTRTNPAWKSTTST